MAAHIPRMFESRESHGDVDEAGPAYFIRFQVTSFWPMRFAGLQCLQDGTFFRKPQFVVIALDIHEMHPKQSAITLDVVAMRVDESGFSVHDVTSSCRAYSIVHSTRKRCGKRFTDIFAQCRTSSVMAP